MTDQNKLAERLAALRATYTAQLPARLEEIRSAFIAAVEAEDSAVESALERLQHLTHKLAGSAATYGFEAIGQQARVMETLSVAALEGDVDQRRQAIVGPVQEAFRLFEALVSAAVEPDVQAEKAECNAKAPSHVQRRSDQRSERVLVVDDDEALLETLADELKAFGYAVETETDADKVDERVRETSSDAVVMNVVFGDQPLAGPEAVKRAQERGGLSVPVVFISSDPSFTSRLAAVRAGGEAYLVKPVVVGQVVDVLDRLLTAEQVEPGRILIIDDDTAMAHYTEAILHNAGMITKVLTDPLKVLDAVESFAPELILLDMYMPECDGRELSRVIRQDGDHAGLPIVFLSGESDAERQLKAMQHGGDDFITKPFQPAHLISAIRSRVDRFRWLRNRMVRDSLTGLLNHTTTNQFLEKELARATREKQPVTFAMVDLDHFKQVNDTYGHGVGDRVIQSLARVLKQRLRTNDVIGRMGGEEFGVILPNTGIEDGKRILDDIRGSFEKIRHASDEGDFRVTLSTGVAQFPDFRTAHGLKEAADGALYAAKHEGRNCVITAEPD